MVSSLGNCSLDFVWIRDWQREGGGRGESRESRGRGKESENEKVREREIRVESG